MLCLCIFNPISGITYTQYMHIEGKISEFVRKVLRVASGKKQEQARSGETATNVTTFYITKIVSGERFGLVDMRLELLDACFMAPATRPCRLARSRVRQSRH